jgi:hypothetical protein
MAKIKKNKQEAIKPKKKPIIEAELVDEDEDDIDEDTDEDDDTDEDEDEDEDDDTNEDDDTDEDEDDAPPPKKKGKTTAVAKRGSSDLSVASVDDLKALLSSGKKNKDKRKQFLIDISKSLGSVYKFESGRTVLRIMPGLGDEPDMHALYTHWIEVLRDKQVSRVPYACAAALANKKCAFCEVNQAGRSLGVFAKIIEPVETKPFLVILRGVEVINLVKEEYNDDPDIIDINEGRDLIVTRKGTGEMTKWSAKFAKNPSPAFKSDAEALDFYNRRPISELKRQLAALDYKLAKRELGKMVNTDDDDDDEDQYSVV